MGFWSFWGRMRGGGPKIGLALILAWSGVTAASGQDPRGYRGRWNSWQYEAMSLDLDVWRVTLPAEEGDHHFKIAWTNWDSGEWTHDGTLALGTVVDAYTAGGNSSISATVGRHYTIAMNNVGYGTPGLMIVQETEHAPVSITSVSHSADGLTTSVTLGTSAEPSAGEKMYVRHSLDGWATSLFAEAAGSGTNWTAEIEHDPAEEGWTNAYYVLTTTVAEPTHAHADLQAIRWNDNGGANFAYIVGTGEAPPGPGIRINEFLASNAANLADEDGDFSDWIELYNPGDQSVNLLGYGLTDDPAIPFRWVFPDVTIGAGEYRLVWASGKDRRPADGELSSGILREVYRDIAGTSVAALTNHPRFPDHPDSRHVETELFEAPSWIGDHYGQRMHGYILAPATGTYRFYISSDDNSELYLSSDMDPENAELIASVPEWTEFRQWDKYSSQRSALIPLEEGQLYYICALMKEGDQGDHLAVGWRLPDSSFERPIPGHHLFSDRELHANFAISASGETLQLTNPEGAMVDQSPSLPLPADISHGRSIGDPATWLYYDQPTPGAANDTPGYGELLSPPAFSAAAGLYAAGFSLDIAADSPGATVRYTTDGSAPTPASPAVSGPLALASRAGEPNDISMIPTNADLWEGESWQPPDGEVFKIHTIRARVFKDGALPSRIVTRSYLVHPDAASRYSVPVVSIATDRDNLFDANVGIYVKGNNDNYFQRGPDWERPAHIEFFEADGTLGFAQDIGLRIHGGTTRNRPRKSLRVYARAEYGESWIEYPLFPDKPQITRYKRFLLRNSGNDWDQTLFRDAMMQSLMAGTDMDIQHSRPAVVFVNGEYWGLHNVRDRYDDRYLDTHYGTGDEANITVLEDRVDTGSGSYDRGDPSGVALYNDLRAFLASPGVADPENLAYVETQMDVDNFIDLQTARIFFRDTDWPGNNQPFWRFVADYNPAAPRGLDGRWRWMLLDTDFGFGLDFWYVWESGAGNGNNDASHNTLEYALDPDGPRNASGDPNWPNPPWSTYMLRQLTHSAAFRARFINRFADRLNSRFHPDHAAAVINGFEAQYAPEVHEHIRRWRYPANTAAWSNHVQTMRTFALARAGYMRTHIVNTFSEVTGTFSLTVDVADDEAGYLRVNSLDVAPGEPGIGAEPYPWTGTYFLGVPVQVTAVPRPGFAFAGWSHDPGEESDTLVVSSTSTIEPLFTESGSETVLIHYWNFNAPETQLAPSYTLVAGAGIAIDTGTASVVTSGTGQDFWGENARFDDPAGAHLRLNDPIGATMDVAMPTTGFEDVVIQYETRRSTSGAGSQILSYTTDGASYVPMQSLVVTEIPTLYPLDFSAIAGTSDNPAFGLRIEFEQGTGGVTGNNRFDNWTVEGTPLGEINLPPEVIAPVPLQELIEGAAAVTINLNDVFADPDGDPLVFDASSDDVALVAVGVTGATLSVTPLRRGGAVVTVTADDGQNPPVSTTFRVLVYPGAHALEHSNFRFGEWDPDLPEKTYPEHMLFLQSDRSDTELATPLTYAYHIAHDDYHANDAGTIGFPYNNTGRSRINGLNDDGIAFINTGSGRDLGGTLLALDTRNVDVAPVSWLGGTVLANTRIYAIRLQYRAGATGEFLDVLDGDDQPVEYIRNTTGHSQPMGSVLLPAAALGQEYVQVLWRYYWTDPLGATGARAQLRLDDVLVANNAAAPAVALEFAIEPPAYALSGAALPPFSVRAVDGDGLTDINYAGTISLSLDSGSGVLGGDTSVPAVAGMAVFDAATITGAGAHVLRATASGLAPAVSGTVIVDADPIFLPGGTAAWNNDDHWTSAAFPNAVDAAAKILAPASAARNVDVNAPITIGALTVDNADSAVRNRIRGQVAGNSLTFAASSGTAALTILGDDLGFVEFEVVGGAVLASDLAIAVDNIAGDPEYGALRLRQGWSGPGGIVKAGAGMASLTGGDKAFAGAIRIEQGVLAFTQPSSPTNSAGTTVQPGGQVRLTSANDEFGARIYSFGGTLSLSGSGRSGVPESEGMGVLGALRYEPGATTNRAVVLGPVQITAPAGIHVAHESNEMEFAGALSGAAALSKSGGGTLIFAGAGSTYTGEIEVETGGLMVQAAIPASSVLMKNGTFVGGTGSLGGNLHLNAGAGWLFDPSGPLGVGGTATFGGFGVVDLIGLDEDTPAGTYPLIDGEVNTANVANLGAGAAVAIGGDKTAYFSAGLALVVQGGAAPTGYEAWKQNEFSPEDQADPAISGPEADPDEPRVPNLLRYGLGMSRADDYHDFRPLGGVADAMAYYRHRRLLDPASGVVYGIQFCDDLEANDWTDAVVGMHLEFVGAAPNGDGVTETVEYRLRPGAVARYLRLRILLAG